MFDPISLAAGAVILGAGFLAGRIRRPGPQAEKPITATCECKHSLAMHDPKKGLCYGKVHIPNLGHNNDCTCRHYVGPKPIESMFALPILPPSEE